MPVVFLAKAVSVTEANTIFNILKFSLLDLYSAEDPRRHIRHAHHSVLGEYQHVYICNSNDPNLRGLLTTSPRVQSFFRDFLSSAPVEQVDLPTARWIDIEAEAKAYELDETSARWPTPDQGTGEVSTPLPDLSLCKENIPVKRSTRSWTSTLDLARAIKATRVPQQQQRLPRNIVRRGTLRSATAAASRAAASSSRRPALPAPSKQSQYSAAAETRHTTGSKRKLGDTDPAPPTIGVAKRMRAMALKRIPSEQR